ncbi:MAG: hypothetical protein GWN18_04395, partial [Thermoplasmata archaeon]|nr:hypothetical protein [Thermoplasmata archaeon]NIV28604.1 hypothetical protein [Anaerolineae bacterium]NIS19209.1 hypothetical protein [Thermoplasmata archaeon]NIT76185.1 hypothetical protein [Thermoplasmata archaeon]NIU48344.1 hypothetical protein [Thermoplasmata archaeon]
MASVDELLASIPDGPEYNSLRATIERIGELFPGELNEITADRVAGWVNEIETGEGRGRDADQIRDDIFKHIVGVDVIMEVLGVDEKTANDLILGGNDGGINFSDLDIDPETGQVVPDPTATEEGARPEEDQAEEGVGGEGPDEETALTILTSEEMEWFFDPSSGKWYVSYGLPGSDRALVFEADPDQMDSLFGEDMRPTNYSE